MGETLRFCNCCIPMLSAFAWAILAFISSIYFYWSCLWLGEPRPLEMLLLAARPLMFRALKDMLFIWSLLFTDLAVPLLLPLLANLFCRASFYFMMLVLWIDSDTSFYSYKSSIALSAGLSSISMVSLFLLILFLIESSFYTDFDFIKRDSLLGFLTGTSSF